MPSPKSRPRPFTVKQQGFVSEFPTAPSGTDAALKVYDVHGDRNMAAVIASQNLRKPAIREAIQAIQDASIDAAVASLHERKATLSAIIRDKRPGPYPVEAVISASDQLNKLERVYAEPQAGNTIIINVVREGPPRKQV